MKLLMIIGCFLWVSVSFASGGGGGGSGGAADGAASRAKEASPEKVYEAREKLRERMKSKSEVKNSKSKAFDHSYKSLTSILAKTVKFNKNKQKSTVSYTAFSKAEVDKVVNEFLALNKKQVMTEFSKKERLAYFINLYNVLTLKLIKDNYAKVKKEGNTIKAIGSIFKSPWDKKFFTLFGVEHTLNNIEHGFIRGDKSGYAQSKKEYTDPRIHFAVNCASKGCPALIDKAFTAQNLESEFQKAMVNFLKDRDRNYVKGSKLYLSPIIESWYKKDFSKGLLGYKSVKDFAAKNAQYLTEKPAELKMIKDKKLSTKSSDYDWTLNDAF